MAKAQTTNLSAQSCGASAIPNGPGRCDGCGEWNTLAKRKSRSPAGPAKPSRLARSEGPRRPPIQPINQRGTPPPRDTCRGWMSFDRVLGGGLVAAFGGAGGRRSGHRQIHPVACRPPPGFARNWTENVIYISGEEASRASPFARAKRLGLADAPVQAGHRNKPARHPDHARGPQRPDLAIVDSIQTMWADNVGQRAGVRQLKCAPPRTN